MTPAPGADSLLWPLWALHTRDKRHTCRNSLTHVKNELKSCCMVALQYLVGRCSRGHRDRTWGPAAVRGVLTGVRLGGRGQGPAGGALCSRGRFHGIAGPSSRDRKSRGWLGAGATGTQKAEGVNWVSTAYNPRAGAWPGQPLTPVVTDNTHVPGAHTNWTAWPVQAQRYVPAHRHCR